VSEAQAIAEICAYPWRFAADPFRIAGGLYYVGNRNVSSYLIDTGGGLILLDTTFPQTVYLLLESIRRLGFDPGDIRYILISHGHYDHMGGAKAIAEVTGARTVMGRADAEMLNTRPELSWAPEYGVELYEAFEPDITPEDRQIIALGQTEITCLHTPGHTPGCLSYLFEVTESGRRYRVGTFGGPGFNTLSDEYLRKRRLPFSLRTDYLNSVARLKREHVDIFIGVHPGQSNNWGKLAAMSKERNPFINSGDWPAFLTMLEDDARARFGPSDGR